MEDTVTYEQELEQQDPIPKPKKLKIKDFAAKIKAKYPDYKDMDDTELTNRIVTKYPEYKDQVDLTPETSKKKVGTIGLEESSLQAGNVLSQSGGVGGEEIPKVEKNDIDVALEYGKLKGATKWGATPSSGKAGEVFGEIPNEEKRKAANKLAQDFNKVDLEGLSQEYLDFPEAAFERETTSKEVLLKLRKENPIQYAARLNNAKTVYKIAEKSDIATANRFNQLADIDYGSLDGFISGKQQQQDIINQTLTGVDKDKATARLKENASRFINSLNPDLVDEYENSDIKGIVDANQYAGLKTWEVFEPEKYKQAIAMLKEPIVPQYQYEINVTPEEKQKSITTDSALAAQYGGKLLQSTINQQIGKETILRQLNGQGLQNAAKDIQYRQYVLAQRNKTAKDDAEKFQIAQEYIQTENELAALTKSQKDEDAKYPYTAQLKFDQQVKDITLDRGASVGELMYNRYAHGIGSTVDAGEDLATTLFGSESDKAKLRNKRIGEQKVFEGSVYLPPNEQRINPEEIIVPSDELKKKVNGLLKGRSLNSLSEQERKKVNYLVAANQDQIETITNPEAGKSKNFFSKATALSVASFTSDIAAFMTNMGMLKGVGLGGKLAEATTLFKDGYTEAFNKKINEGASINSANEYGLLHGGILALMAKFGSKYEAVQNILKGGKSPMAKKIAGMSEETWNNIYNENKGIISRLASSSKNVAKEQGKMIGTFGIAAPTLSSLADNAFYDQHKSVSQMASEAATSAEEMLVGSLGFIVAGLAKGAMKPKATPLEKAALWELGDNPELGKAKIDEAVKLNDLTKEDGERRKGTIDKVSKLIEKVPTKNDKNIPLTDNQKTNYLYNLLVKENAKDEAKSLPEKQAEVKEKEGLVADFNNQILLSNSTEKQLTNRKEELEKQLNEKDDKGKLVISDQDKIKVEAEIEAIDSHLDTTKKEVKEEELPNLSQPIPELNVDNKGIPIGENVPPEVKGEPEKITQPIELSAEGKTTEIYAEKPDLKLELVSANDLVNSKDPIGNRERHNEIKERYKKLRQLIDCL